MDDRENPVGLLGDIFRRWIHDRLTHNGGDNIFIRRLTIARKLTAGNDELFKRFLGLLRGTTRTPLMQYSGTVVIDM